jgi:hypothetical protein
MAVAKDVIFVNKIRAEKLHTLLTIEYFLFASATVLTPYRTVATTRTTTFNITKHVVHSVYECLVCGLQGK